MIKNIKETNLATDAKSALGFWAAHPGIKLQETSCAEFKKTQTAFQQAADEVLASEKELRSKITERDALASEVNLVVTRLRSVVKGFYGPDSTEYEQVGGTRTSDRKRPARRKEVQPAATAAAPATGNGNGN
jgi:hypothetical protein